MAVVLGTNAGFVTEAPATDPTGLNNDIDQSARATKHTCPADVTTISEIGFWVDNTHTAHSYDVGLYSHDSGSDTADALLFSSTGHTTTGSAEWNTVSGLDWEVTPGTVYWIAVLLGSAGGTDPEGDYAATGGRTGIRTGVGELPNPFSTQGDGENIRAFYALVESSAVELSGTIAAQSVIENANLSIGGGIALSGTIAVTSTVGPSSLGSVSVGLTVQTAFIKRLVVAGNNQIWIEDI
jgi:hypothetical protein